MDKFKDYFCYCCSWCVDYIKKQHLNIFSIAVGIFFGLAGAKIFLEIDASNFNDFIVRKDKEIELANITIGELRQEVWNKNDKILEANKLVDELPPKVWDYKCRSTSKICDSYGGFEENEILHLYRYEIGKNNHNIPLVPTVYNIKPGDLFYVCKFPVGIKLSGDESISDTEKYYNTSVVIAVNSSLLIDTVRYDIHKDNDKLCMYKYLKKQGRNILFSASDCARKEKELPIDNICAKFLDQNRGDTWFFFSVKLSDFVLANIKNVGNFVEGNDSDFKQFILVEPNPIPDVCLRKPHFSPGEEGGRHLPKVPISYNSTANFL